MIQARPAVLGAVTVAVLAVAVPVALTRHGAAATTPAAPLSVTDRQALSTSRPLIDAIPAAISEVPLAASDASHGRVTPSQATGIVQQTPALSPLARAIASPATVSGPLSAAYRSVLAGHPPQSADRLPAALEALQTVEGEIEPAIRLVAAHGGTPPTAATALAAVARDPHTKALAAVVARWQQVYGTFTLVEEFAAAS